MAFAAVVALLTVALTIMGLSLQPSNGPPTPSNELSLLSFSIEPRPNTSSLPASMSVTEAVDFLGGTATLLRFWVDANVPGAVSYAWTVMAVNFHGQLCSTRGGIRTSHGNLVPNTKIQNPQGALTEFQGATSSSDEQSTQEVFQLDLCWQSGGPGTLKDGYLTATLPEVEFTPAFGATVPYPWQPPEMLLNQTLGGGPQMSNTLAEYQQQAGQPPTDITADRWTWTNTLTNAATSNPRLINAVSLPQLQRENHNAFLSGVLFGVAAGAFIVLLQELLVPLRRRP